MTGELIAGGDCAVKGKATKTAKTETAKPVSTTRAMEVANISESPSLNTEHLWPAHIMHPNLTAAKGDS
jgi:hypothetical protein